MKFVPKVREFYHTLRNVKPVQISYRLKYGLRRIRSLKKINVEDQSFSPLSMLPVPSAHQFVEITKDGIKVTFLNKSETYQNRVKWNDLKHGRLWNYHLRYADFLKQDDLSVSFREELILDLYRWLHEGKLKPEPYPSSLRTMNVIRFLSENHERLEAEYDLIESLYSEFHFLENRLEYHLLGNHLMENAFALLMGGISFNKQKWIKTAEGIFEEQISEQILKDGAHFERSPMYHLIMLFRFLEAVYYLPSDSKIFSRFFNISKQMLGWIDQMSFRNGDLAHFNDSTNGQSYSKVKIFEMAKKCGVKDLPKTELSDSGFRKFSNKNFELFVDADGINPSYQPAHAHADSLSFILHIDSRPVIVDPGVSTYETGGRRFWERSTKAHNTVTYNSQNTADIWDKFRVGRRPQVDILNESNNEISVRLQHKLMSGDMFVHQRRFSIMDHFIEISDQVNLSKPVDGRLYFDPTVNIKTLTNEKIELDNGLKIDFIDIQKLSEFTYEFCRGFNLLKKSTGIEYSFIKQASIRLEVSKP